MARFGTILCPVDFSPATPRVVAYAKDLATALQARLVLLHVSRPMLRFTAVEVGMENIARFANAVHEGAVKNMQAMKAELLPETDAVLRVETGYPAEIILAVAKETNADLIVMGTHGYAGLKRMVFGSVAEKIAKNSPIPVLTVRPYDETTQHP